MSFVTNSCLLIFIVSVFTPSTAVIDTNDTVSAGGGGEGEVFPVTSRFSDGNRSLSALKEHDNLRHLQILATGVDLPLGGTGRPSDSVGLYYAKIGVGTPSKEYYVQVDTGTDIMWINGVQCTECPKRGYNGMELTLYDPDYSVTSTVVSCDQDFCIELNRGPVYGCHTNGSCLFTEAYGDGSYSMGYFVQDVVQYDSVSGDLQTKLVNGSVVFGCGARQSGDLGSSDDGLDGILGFGKSNSSILSQLAAAGKVKKMFAHCLDVTGGGIFAIGQVVQPKVNSTPLIPDQLHYAVNMTGIEVGLVYLNISANATGDTRTTIIDSGTTLAYLPEAIFQPLIEQIISWQSDLRFLTPHDQYTCFDFSGSVDDGFPPVTFYFENSISLKVYPHDYLFPFEDMLCLGWQSNGPDSRGKNDIILLGDLVLSNKLVLYDLENQTIGWTEYNCSSNIKLRDEITGSVHLVGPHSLPSACSRNTGVAVIFLILASILHHVFL